jgi:hypothetical protein
MATTNKMLTDWHEKGCNMVYKITYLMKLYSILRCLMVNIDQTGIHFVPTTGERTWENKGSKHIQVLRVKDKRQVTLMLSFTTNGNLLPGKLFSQVQHIGVYLLQMREN